MSYNGSGTFQINTSGQPVVTGTSISSTVFNALTADLATGLSTAITKDGQTTTTARIPFALGINSTLVTDATNTTSGSIIAAGGVGIAKALYVGTTANVAGAVTLGGVATFSAQPIFSSLTASSAVATDASKGLVSVTNTGTGNNVLATTPTIATPVITGDATISGLTVGKGAGAVATNTAVGASALAAVTTQATTTAIGYQAGQGVTSGSASVFVGDRVSTATSTSLGVTGVGSQALQVNNGNYNTGIGFGSLNSTNSGANNTAVGASALQSNTTASNNTAVGYQALYTSNGGQNVAVGGIALYSSTTAIRNTAVGYSALDSTTTGQQNTAVGAFAGDGNTTGGDNAFLGYDTGSRNTTGAYNTALGSQALLSNTTASYNTAIGYQAGYSNVTGSQCVYVGIWSGQYATGSGNTALGYSAYGAVTNPSSGTYNTCVGNQAGSTITSGSYNTYIGVSANPSSGSVSGELVVSADSSATGKGANTGFIKPGGSGVYQANNSASWSTTSDRRLKKNIADNTVGLDAIASIRVRNFEYRLPNEVDAELKPTDAVDKSGIQLGVIAQELNEVLPDCVKTESTGVMSVDPDNLTWYMVNAIKELKAEVDSLKAQINGASA